MAADTLTIYCLVSGDPLSTAFPVGAKSSETVGSLKNAVFDAKPKALGRDDNDANDLILWRATIPDDKTVENDRKITVDALVKKTRLDKPRTRLSVLFPESPDENTYIVVERPKGIKRAHTGNIPMPDIKRFKANSTVYKAIRSLVYYADQTDNNQPLVQKILNGDFLQIYGARASGKSSRVIDAMDALSSECECLYVDLQSVNFSSDEAFWPSLCRRLQPYGLPQDFNNSDGFQMAFATTHQRWTKPVVIFLDEFDPLHADSATEICSSVLSALRSIRNDPSRGKGAPQNAISSVVSIGTYGILKLTQSNSALSPFNSSDNLQNRGLSTDQVHALYNEFAVDRDMTIDNEVTEDIFLLSNGHAGLVNICGVALDKYLSSKPHGLHVDMTHWGLIAKGLLVQMESYGTFQQLIKDLAQGSGRMKTALAFYRSRFLGNPREEVVVVHELPNRELARHLVALGVLRTESDDGSGDKFEIASPLVDSLIRHTVIPVAYPNAPKIQPPRVKPDGSLDILEITKTTLRFFDKAFIAQASEMSYKAAHVPVNGAQLQHVPRESVYDSEMTRILRNWLATQNGHEIIGRHHVTSLFCNMVIRAKGKRPVVLEMMATDIQAKVQEHIGRTVNYMRQVGANEGWVIQFTRQENYLNNPYWAADEVLNAGVKMIHIWHNKEFTEVRLSAKWRTLDGRMVTVNDERVI
ncbi:hypothetical protein EMPS_05602 [Entomortierella parvispora]|uniref:Crinkler effector protein N-terminal domain-containing protein n=1 Tax=Entomortierella parvispora TaxID=205924 RepID=A0A9P3HAN3_9FUNG|nr:hypothetical protein EMPS_05602 [Entomortierella parvispora]